MNTADIAEPRSAHASTHAADDAAQRLAGVHILIVVENLSVPFDRRVWQESCALRDAGAEVSVICPRGNGFTAAFERRNGIEIYRHPMPIEARRWYGYIAEYACAVFWELWLAAKIFARKRFHILQGCNPPDLIFLVALPFKLFGVKYVFDHHDISPELFIAKFGRLGFIYRLIVWLERLNFATANFSIATNESYREIAITRGKMPLDQVAVIRNGPDLDRIRIVAPNPDYKRGRRYLVGYVGVIGEQEGLDILLDVARRIGEQRSDVQFAIVGGGTELPRVRQMAAAMGLDGTVEFYGRVSDDALVAILNTSDVCVNPDVPTVMNNLSTMTKIMEYMALKKPIVQFDLKEGRYSADEASLYAQWGDNEDFARKIEWLLEHPTERQSMGEIGYRRIVERFSWEHSSQRLVDFYAHVAGRAGA